MPDWELMVQYIVNDPYMLVQGLELVVAQLAALPGVLQQRDQSRATPFDIATKCGFSHMADILQSAAAAAAESASRGPPASATQASSTPPRGGFGRGTAAAGASGVSPSGTAAPESPGALMPAVPASGAASPGFGHGRGAPPGLEAPVIEPAPAMTGQLQLCH